MEVSLGQVLAGGLLALGVGMWLFGPSKMKLCDQGDTGACLEVLFDLCKAGYQEDCNNLMALLKVASTGL